MKKIILSIVSLAAVLAVNMSGATPAGAALDCTGANAESGACKALGGAKKTTAPADRTRTVEGVFESIANVLLFVIGAISVIMIIVGGLRYVTSGGDTSAVTSAKNTILYAVVGLVVALFSFAMVRFVIAQFS